MARRLARPILEVPIRSVGPARHHHNGRARQAPRPTQRRSSISESLGCASSCFRIRLTETRAGQEHPSRWAPYGPLTHTHTDTQAGELFYYDFGIVDPTELDRISKSLGSHCDGGALVEADGKQRERPLPESRREVQLVECFGRPPGRSGGLRGGPNVVQHVPLEPRFAPEFGEVWPIRAHQFRSVLFDVGELAEHGPKLAKLGQVWLSLVRCWPNFANTWPTSA